MEDARWVVNSRSAPTSSSAIPAAKEGFERLDGQLAGARRHVGVITRMGLRMMGWI
jgi:hypothetical protein